MDAGSKGQASHKQVAREPAAKDPSTGHCGRAKNSAGSGRIFYVLLGGSVVSTLGSGFRVVVFGFFSLGLGQGLEGSGS